MVIFSLCFAIACVNRSVTRELQASNVAGAVQFRFFQEEHAGAYCSCWGISDLVVYNGTTRFTDERYINTVVLCNFVIACVPISAVFSLVPRAKTNPTTDYFQYTGSNRCTG